MEEQNYRRSKTSMRLFYKLETKCMGLYLRGAGIFLPIYSGGILEKLKLMYVYFNDEFGALPKIVNISENLKFYIRKELEYRRMQFRSSPELQNLPNMLVGCRVIWDNTIPNLLEMYA